MRNRRATMTVGALSLMSATILTNVLGLVFWAVAALIEPTQIVGKAAAVIASLTLLSTVAQLNLNNIYVRFLPTAGRATRRYVWRGYLAVIAFGAVVGTVFVTTGLGRGIVDQGWKSEACYCVAVVLLAIFALQDSVLTALRRTHWVPVENGSFSVAKLVLLPALVFLPTGGRLVAAWVLPVAVAVLVVSWLLANRVFPTLNDVEPAPLPKPRRLLSFLGGEYATNLSATATVQLMPLIVVWQLGATATAWFTLPWLACMAISVLLWNVATALVVEVVSSSESAHAIKRGLILWGAIVGVSLLGCTVLGPDVLRVVGSSYAAHGAELLRLIGLSAPFMAVTVLYGAFAWLDQRIWRLAAIQFASGVLMIALAIVLIPHCGIAGVGWANLVAQGTAAVIMLPTVWRRLVKASVFSSDAIEVMA
jgi:O-antigen/teichoic acid export membrane protein